MARGVKKTENAPDKKAGFDPVLVALGVRVRALRDGKGLTQAQLGARAGVSGAYIWLVETGGQNLSIKVLRRLAEVLDVTMGGLLSFGDSELAPSQETLGYLAGKLDRACETLQARIEQEERILQEMRTLSSEVRVFLDGVYKDRRGNADDP